MADLNKVFLIGNLTRDPEYRPIGERNAVTKLGLATNRKYTTRNGEEREEVCFVDVEVWGRQAEACSQYLRKGAPAFVEGRLKLDQWEDTQTGQKRSRMLVQAERVQFLGSPSRGSNFQDGGQAYGSGDQAAAPPPARQAPPQPPQQQSYQPPQPQGPGQQPPPQQPPPAPQPPNRMPTFEEDNAGPAAEDDIPF
mgnify:CR=1 FL=1